MEKTIKKLLLLAIVICSVLIGCKKGLQSDTQTFQNLEEEKLKFYNLPTNAPNFVKRISTALKRELNKDNNLDKFIKKLGVPKWDKPLYTPKDTKTFVIESDSSGGGNNDTLVFIPVLNSSQTEVSSFVYGMLTSSGDFVQLYEARDYRDYKYKNEALPNEATSEEIASLFFQLEARVFGEREFEIKDKKLFKKTISNLVDKQFVHGSKVKITPDPTWTSTYGKVASAYSMICTAVLVGTEIWWDPDGVDDPCDCSGNEVYMYTNWSWNKECEKVWNSGGGGGGSGGGGGGGGPTGPDCPTCPPPPPNPCSNNSISSTLNSNDCENSNGWDPFFDFDENGFSKSRMQELMNEIDGDKDFLIPCPEIQKFGFNGYGSLIQSINNSTISPVATSRIANLLATNPDLTKDNFYIRDINKGTSATVNTDYFGLQVSTMPTINGTQMNPATLLEFFRTHISQFISPSIGISFNPYLGNSINDIALWNSQYSGCISSLVHLDMVNDGTVIVSNYNSNSTGLQDHSFTVSTMVTPKDGNHPVSGNRRFGVNQRPHSLTGLTLTNFYISAADRITDKTFEIGNWIKTAATGFSGFDDADALWRDVIKNFKNFINQNGGLSYDNLVLPELEIIARPKWEDVKDFLEKKITFDQLKAKLKC